MFGSPAELNAYSISAWILRYACRYATFMGVNWFRISHNSAKDCRVAKSRLRIKWFGLLMRILMCFGYCFTIINTILSRDNISLILLLWMRLLTNLLFNVIIFVIHFWYEQKVLHLLNGFFRLFKNVNTLRSCPVGVFGGKRVLSLLIFNALSLVFGFCRKLPELFYEFDIYLITATICDLYISVNAAMICHISCLGYLSVTTLFDQLNSFVRHELRRELRGLGHTSSPGQRRAARTRLDQCLTNYDEILKLAKDLHRFLELPLFLFLLVGFLNIGLMTLYIIVKKSNAVSLTLFVIKYFVDILLLTLTIDGARSSSRIVRRLSLENYYLAENKNWHLKLEMFLGRLNYNEFNVRPLGLFEISNELILVLLSGLVTYITFIIQYAMQYHQI